MRVMAHATARKFMRFMTVSLDERFLGMARLAAPAEPEPAAAAHAVAVRTGDLRGRVVRVLLAGAVRRLVARMEADLALFCGRLEEQAMGSGSQLGGYGIDARKGLFDLERFAVKQELGRFSFRDDLH